MASRRIIALLFLFACVMNGCGASPMGPRGSGTAPAPPPVTADVTLEAVGDIMLDRGVAEAIARNGPASVLFFVDEQLRAADIGFANLECPLATFGPRDPDRAVFRADPKTVAVLVRGGFDIVSLANNHTLNSGPEALLETISHLADAGIDWVGAQRDPVHGSDPAYLDVRGTRIGFLAYADLDFEFECQSKLGDDLSPLVAAVAAAKRDCDLLVVSFHWGVQESDAPTARQVEVARAAVDSGADVVLGHHPHVLQGAEIYRSRLILYSMGDFVFDPRTTEEAEGGIFEIRYRIGVGLQLSMTPVFIPSTRMGPEYPGTAERNRILRRFSRLSAARGATPVIANGVALLESRF